MLMQLLGIGKHMELRFGQTAATSTKYNPSLQHSSFYNPFPPLTLLFFQPGCEFIPTPS